MKKFMLMAVAVLTLGLTSCKEEVKNDEAAAVIENLKNELESGDANAVQTTLQNAQEKIAELVAKDPEAAKTYVTKIQDFVKENKEKITAVVGENAATQTLVNALIDTPAETIINTLTVGQAVLDNAEKTAEGVKDSVNQALENKANEMQDAVQDAVNEKVDEAKQKANDEINKAAEKANEKINETANEALKSIGL